MSLLKIIFAVTLMLFAATGFAAPKEKTLICHVGNEVGPNGEDYLDDPGCVPIEENNYFCPDAGKIDLISVAKPSKHLGNPSHTYDGISDYLPADVGASGEGDEDSDGDGVDDGCRPPSACPCWDDLGFLGVPANCIVSASLLIIDFTNGNRACSGVNCAVADPAPSCGHNDFPNDDLLRIGNLTAEEDAACQAVIEPFCPNTFDESASSPEESGIALDY